VFIYLAKMLPSALSSVFQIRVLFFETLFLDVFICVWGEADFLDTATEMVLFQDILLYFLYLLLPFFIKDHYKST